MWSIKRFLDVLKKRGIKFVIPYKKGDKLHAYLLNSVEDLYRAPHGVFASYINGDEWTPLYEDAIWEQYKFGGDRHKLAAKLKERGYNVEHEGRSGFDARNKYIMSISNPESYVESKHSTVAIVNIYLEIDDECFDEKRLDIIDIGESSLEEALEKAEGGEDEEYKVVIFKTTLYKNRFYEKVVEPILNEMRAERLQKLQDVLTPYMDRDVLYVFMEDKEGEIPLILYEEDVEEATNGQYVYLWSYSYGGDYRRNILPKRVICYVKRGTHKSINVLVINHKNKIGKLVGKGGKRIKEFCKKNGIKFIRFSEAEDKGDIKDLINIRKISES